MKDALQRCNREDITIQTGCGPVVIKAWRLGGFACRQGRGSREGRWVVTHLETGFQLSTAGTFDSEDDAANAMEEIADAADWSDLSIDGRRNLGKIVRRIFAAHGATTD